jgi:hypothetical protein
MNFAASAQRCIKIDRQTLRTDNAVLRGGLGVRKVAAPDSKASPLKASRLKARLKAFESMHCARPRHGEALRDQEPHDGSSDVEIMGCAERRDRCPHATRRRPNHPGQIFITQNGNRRLDRHDRDGVTLAG